MISYNSFKTITNSLTQKTIGGLASFKEYVSSTVLKFTRFSSYQENDSEYTNSGFSCLVSNSITYGNGLVTIPITSEQYNQAILGEQITIVDFANLGVNVTLTSSQVLDLVDETSSFLSLRLIDCDDNEKGLTTLTPELFNIALAGDIFITKVNDGDNYIIVNGDVVSENINDSISNLQIQKEYIDYCLNNVSTRASEFSTLMSSKFGSIPSYIVDNYAQLLSVQDPVMALKSLFSTLQDKVTSKKTVSGTVFISVFDPTGFTGASILETAWNNVWGTISSFFNVAWEGITKIGNFIKKIFDGLVSAVKYLVNLVMKPLTTRFEKAGCSVGVLDVPIAQYQLAKISWTIGTRPVVNWTDDWTNTTLSTYLSNLYSSSDWLVDLHSGAETIDCDGRNAGYEARYPAEMWSKALSLLLDSVFEEVDGNVYSRPYDVLLPSDDESYSMVARVGLSNTGVDDEYYLNIQLYVIMPNADISTMADGAIYNRIRALGKSVISTIYKNIPRTNTGLDLDSGDLVFGMDNTVLDTDDNLDMIPHLHWFNFAFDNPTSLVTITDINCGTWSLVSALVPYIIQFGPEYERVLNRRMVFTAFNSRSDIELLEALGISGGEWGADDVTYPTSITLELRAVDYQPYLESNLFGASVHYQTLSEAANEFIKYIIVIFIAAAATFIAVKWNQFKKRRINLAEINQGYVDNLSWNLPQNPSKDDLKQYAKVKKVAKKTNKLNNLLGISGSSQSTNSVLDAVFSVKDQLLSTQGLDQSADDLASADLLSIRKLINNN